MTNEPRATERWRDRVRGILRRTRETLNTPVGELLRGAATAEEALEELEEALIRADVGLETTTAILEALHRAARKGTENLEEAVRAEFLRVLTPEGSANPAPDAGLMPEEGDSRPRVLFLVGVNGTGKTTTTARLARRIQDLGGRVVLAAADTFRAAAIEQLQEWGKRVEAPVIHHRSGGDPSAVIYDAIESARSRGADVVLADTAGRSHTRADLMGELQKMGRIAGREVPGAPHEVFLVLDGTTGQNGLQQAREFAGVLPLSGLILTKMDGTAKGGIALAAVRELGVPIRWVGLGEGLEDLVPFEASAYVDGLFQ